MQQSSVFMFWPCHATRRASLLRVVVLMSCLVALLPGCSGQKGFRLSSPAVEAGQSLLEAQVFKGFGCTGANVSPQLNWENAPSGTKSFALTLYDPDAPTGSGWWHWVIFNIPATTTRLNANAGDLAAQQAPSGSIQSRTDFGAPGYGGPCPPAGDRAHRYQFTVYALDVDQLPLDANASGALVGFYLNQHALGRAMLEGRYAR